MKTPFFLLLTTCFSLGLSLLAAPAPTAVSTDVNDILVWDRPEQSIKAGEEDKMVNFVFTVTNRSAKEVVINQATGGCECTKAQPPSMPWKLAPGAIGVMPVTVDLQGKSGAMTKSLTISSTAGIQSLIMRVDAPLSKELRTLRREMNLEQAKADRQKVLKGSCAVCHVEKGEGKLGEELFVADCAICHNPPHGRAEIVPDLAALKYEMTEESWRNVIANGGKPGTLMPAFAKKHEGPLSDEQIESLVKYVMQKFPFDPAKAKAAAPGETPKTEPAPK